MINSSLFSFIMAEFAKRNISKSAHFVDAPSYEDISTIVESVLEWAKQNNIITKDGNIPIKSFID